MKKERDNTVASPITTAIPTNPTFDALFANQSKLFEKMDKLQNDLNQIKDGLGQIKRQMGTDDWIAKVDGVEEEEGEQVFEDLVEELQEEELQEEEEEEDTLKLILDHLLEIKSKLNTLDYDVGLVKRRLSKVETHTKTAVAYIKVNK